MTAVELDPRWDWVEVTYFGSAEARYVKGRCNHLDVVPVESVVDGQVLANLCLTCDAQLPWELAAEPIGQQQDADDQRDNDE